VGKVNKLALQGVYRYKALVHFHSRSSGASSIITGVQINLLIADHTELTLSTSVAIVTNKVPVHFSESNSCHIR